MKPGYERPQRQNPHQLSIKHHIFPIASIKRFCGRPGATVDLFDITRKCRRRASPKDQAFCAMRKWDHHAETGFIKSFEDAFQPIARSIIYDFKRHLAPYEDAVISRFYALWRTRASYRSKPDEDYRLALMVGQEYEITKDEQERLEKAGVLYTRNCGYPARSMHGLTLLRDIDWYLSLYPNMHWSAWAVADGEVVVPDYTTALIVPLTPTLFLAVADSPAIVRWPAMVKINQALLSDAQEYFFAHNLSRCAGVF